MLKDVKPLAADNTGVEENTLKYSQKSTYVASFISLIPARNIFAMSFSKHLILFHSNGSSLPSEVLAVTLSTQ